MAVISEAPPFGLAVHRSMAILERRLETWTGRPHGGWRQVLGVRRTSHDLKARIGPILDNNLATVTTLDYQRALGRPYGLRCQGVIATLERVCLMVSCRRGFVEVVC